MFSVRNHKISSRFLNSLAVLDLIIKALDRNEPLSIVSVGATEAFVMAQYTIYSEEEFMVHPEAQIANMGIQTGFYHRGIRFPCIGARDNLIEAVRQADIVGCNTIVESARVFVEQVFSGYNIEPALIFEANIRRVIMFSQKEKFFSMLKGRKVLLIGSLAPQIRAEIEWTYMRKHECQVVGAISIHEYEEIARVKEEIKQFGFDLCLLAAGVNATILAPYIARSCGKVAFDMGSGLTSLTTNEVVMDQWIAYLIGLDKLFSM